MSRHDLGKCLIMSEKDVRNLGIDLNRLQRLGDFITPFEKSFFGHNIAKKRLMKHIEEKAEKKDADLVVVKEQTSVFLSLEHVSYDYSLYKY